MFRQDGLKRWAESKVNRFYWLENVFESIVEKEDSGLLDTDFLELVSTERESLWDLALKLSEHCRIDCAPLCCFFPSPYCTAPVAREESIRLRKLLGSEFHRYYSMVPVTALHPAMRDYVKDNPDFIYSMDGVDTACMLNTRVELVDRRWLASKPNTIETGLPIWTDEESQACVFLRKDGECEAYRRGLKLKVCRNFVCTAFLARKLLEWVDIDLEDGENTVQRLNGIYEALDKAVSKEGAFANESAYDSSFREAVVDALNGRKTNPKKMEDDSRHNASHARLVFLKVMESERALSRHGF
ncbi:MAG: hypothetical protein NTU61_06370 [Candidatus Altiarchaeota archaeon]|nr:hypothetical protein [Candidatus Altiarchaeota archaeon]